MKKYGKKREKHTQSGERQYQQTQPMGGVSFPTLGDCLLDAIGGGDGVHPSVCDYEGKRNTSCGTRAKTSYTKWLSMIPHRHI